MLKQMTPDKEKQRLLAEKLPLQRTGYSMEYYGVLAA